MEFWRFTPAPEALGPPLEGSYHPFLVVLSIAVACAAGLTALMIIDRMHAARTRSGRWGWNVAGAFAMGTGIWAMHFTGMLAFSVAL